MSLEKLEKRLTERVEREIEKSGEDLEFAQELTAGNPSVSGAASSLVGDSLPVKFLKAGLVIAGVYLAWSSLSLVQFSGLVYLVTGFLTAKLSDYRKVDWEYWFTSLFWLPAVLYGVLPDRVRFDK